MSKGQGDDAVSQLRSALEQFRDDNGHFCFNATPCNANWFRARKGAKCSPWCRKANAALAAATTTAPAADTDAGQGDGSKGS